MASVSTYLNFPGHTAEAFEFYRSVFKTEYQGPVMRMGDLPPQEGMPPVPEAFKNLVMHVSLPIIGGHVLMGTDAVEGMGHPLTMGDHVSISIQPDSREEADALFAALSEGGKVEMPMAEMFWGAYWGSFTDRFGMGWMINFPTQAH